MAKLSGTARALTLTTLLAVCRTRGAGPGRTAGKLEVLVGALYFRGTAVVRAGLGLDWGSGQGLLQSTSVWWRRQRRRGT